MSKPVIYRGPGAARLVRDSVRKGVALRAPHHTASLEAVVGALRPCEDDGSFAYQPGEIGLAGQGGVLLLTDLAEFRREVIVEIGHALRTGSLQFVAPVGAIVQRLFFRLTIPVDFKVVATTHHCPCGMRETRRGVACVPACSCSEDLVRRFEERVDRSLEVLS